MLETNTQCVATKNTVWTALPALHLVNRTATLEFWRADFVLFRKLVGGVPWEILLKCKRVQEGWTPFKKEILRVQKQAVPTCQETSQHGRRLAWLNREPCLELRKKKVYDIWKKG